MPEKGTEIKVLVRNFLLIKRLEDDKETDGGVRLVGTIVQSVLNDRGLTALNGNDVEVESSTTRYFEYRFNDRSYKNDEVLTPRRTELDGTNVWRTTFQANIPLKIEVEREAFPFKVLKASADIELSSGADGTTRIRPNLVLAKEETRNNMSVNKDTMDGMLKYDLLSEYPEVEYRYEKKKGYCPKYSVTFYLTVDGTEKFVRSVVPLVLVSALNTLFLLDDLQRSDGNSNGNGGGGEDEDDAKKLVAFTSVLALAVVFLFGGTTDPAASKAAAPDILYILFIFVSLILSAISETLVGGSYICRIVGAALFWVSFVFPFSNWARIKMLTSGKRPRKGLEKIFLRDKDYKKQEGFSDEVFVALEPDPNDKNRLNEAAKDQLHSNVYEFLVRDEKNLFIKYPTTKRR